MLCLPEAETPTGDRPVRFLSSDGRLPKFDLGLMVGYGEAPTRLDEGPPRVIALDYPEQGAEVVVEPQDWD